MILTVVSSVIAVAAILGLAIFRYYARASRRSQLAKDSSYSVSRYWRRQLPSISFDSSPPHPQNTEETNETTRIIKSSFSWPEVSPLHKQQPPPEKGEASSPMSSSSSLSNSSTMEQIVEPASFTFGLRWNETTDSLFVRVISARNLHLPRRQRSSNLFDSYVRIELISTSETGKHGIFLFLSSSSLLFPRTNAIDAYTYRQKEHPSSLWWTIRVSQHSSDRSRPTLAALHDINLWHIHSGRGARSSASSAQSTSESERIDSIQFKWNHLYTRGHLTIRAGTVQWRTRVLFTLPLVVLLLALESTVGSNIDFLMLSTDG